MGHLIQATEFVGILKLLVRIKNDQIISPLLENESRMENEYPTITLVIQIPSPIYNFPLKRYSTLVLCIPSGSLSVGVQPLAL